MLNSLSFLNNEVSLSTNPSQLNSYELVIFDSGVENLQQLIEGIKPGVDWVVLNRNQDGIEQITRILANHPDITTLHIISHGAPGCLFLGNTQLNLETLESYTTQLQSWFAPLENSNSPLTQEIDSNSPLVRKLIPTPPLVRGAGGDLSSSTVVTSPPEMPGKNSSGNCTTSPEPISPRPKPPPGTPPGNSMSPSVPLHPNWL
jgi:hypothetical protein